MLALHMRKKQLKWETLNVRINNRNLYCNNFAR